MAKTEEQEIKATALDQKEGSKTHCCCKKEAELQQTTDRLLFQKKEGPKEFLKWLKKQGKTK